MKEELIKLIQKKIRAEFTNQLTIMHIDAILYEALKEVQEDDHKSE